MCGIGPYLETEHIKKQYKKKYNNNFTECKTVVVLKLGRDYLYVILKQKINKRCNSCYLVSELLLIITTRAIFHFQLYLGESKLHFDEMTTMSALY